MEQCQYCKKMFKRVMSHINACPSRIKENAGSDKEEESLTPCPYCKNGYKRLGYHKRNCPERPSKEEGSKGEETVKLTPCPHCKNKYKRLATHLHYCPERPSEKGGEEEEEEEEEEEDENQGMNNKENHNLTMCPHCNKMYKRLATHLYYCPERPCEKEGDEEVKGNEEYEEEDEEEEEKEGGGYNMAPCPHCNKMYKRLAIHLYYCTQRPREKEGDEEDEGDEEEEENENQEMNDEENPNLTPCPYCRKMYKRLASHKRYCPQKPREEEEEEEEEEKETARNVTPCPHCKNIYKKLSSHIPHCRARPKKKSETPDQEISFCGGDEGSNEIAINGQLAPRQRDTFGKDYQAGHTLLRLTPNAARKNTDSGNISKHFENQKFVCSSEQGKDASVESVQNFSKCPSKAEWPINDLTHQYLYGGDVLSNVAKAKTNTSSPVNKQTTHYEFSTRRSEHWDSELAASPYSGGKDLKRPPIHGYQHLSSDVPFGRISVRDDSSFSDSNDEPSFYNSSENEDSFSYLHQDMRRPPIHLTKSQTQRKGKGYQSDFYEYQHLRE